MNIAQWNKVKEKKQEIKQYNFYSEWQITPLSFNSDGEMCQNMSGKLGYFLNLKKIIYINLFLPLWSLTH